MNKYNAGRQPVRTRLTSSPISVSYLMHETLKKCGDNLTRENVMKQAANHQKLKAAAAAAGHHRQHQPDRLLSDPGGPARRASRARPGSCSATSCTPRAADEEEIREDKQAHVRGRRLGRRPSGRIDPRPSRRRSTTTARSTPRSRSATPTPTAARPRPMPRSARRSTPTSRASTRPAASTAARSGSSRSTTATCRPRPSRWSARWSSRTRSSRCSSRSARRATRRSTST